jgi:NAD(P)-dependent dehydrogenase (short-subunit alcohol dehydrogenase family)
MIRLSNKVALVTGASRGVGKGVAMGLGEVGATVYITGRTVTEGEAAVPLAGTVGATAQAVTRLGGQGIAVQCDHRIDSMVDAVFNLIDTEQGRLDVLVNNAWAGYEGYATGKHLPPSVPFWEKPLSFWDENLDGVRWAYVASWHAARRMAERGSGLIVNISFGVPNPGDPSYNVAKTGIDRMTWDMAAQLRDRGVAVVSLYPGLVRTENVLSNAQWFDMSQSQSPLFTGRAVAALAADPDVMGKSGHPYEVAELAREYGFTDVPMD